MNFGNLDFCLFDPSDWTGDFLAHIHLALFSGITNPLFVLLYQDLAIKFEFQINLQILASVRIYDPVNVVNHSFRITC